MAEADLFYKAHVFVCKNERPENHPRGCCLNKGAHELHAYMKERAKAAGLKATRINQSCCLERCELGPVLVIYPEGVWYTYRDKADIDEIIQKHMVEGGRVERLMLLPNETLPAQREARLASH